MPLRAGAVPVLALLALAITLGAALSSAAGRGIWPAARASAAGDGATLSLELVEPLRFGKVAPGTAPGDTIVIHADSGARTIGRGALDLGGLYGRGEYIVRGEPLTRFAIHVPHSVVLTGSGAASIVLRNFTTSPARLGVIGPDGQATIFLGGELQLRGKAAAGSYRGVIELVVESLKP